MTKVKNRRGCPAASYFLLLRQNKVAKEKAMHRVERLMRQQALRVWPRRRSLPADRGLRPVVGIAANVLDRQFDASVPNRKWVADFT